VQAQQQQIDRRRHDEPERRQQQATLHAETDRIREELGRAQSALTDLMQPTFADVNEIKSQIAALEADVARFQEASTRCRDELGSRIGGIYEVDPHPRTALKQLDDRTPFLLLPVRIETIFVPAAPRAQRPAPQLWVRIYPDDIAIHTHEPTLTDREVAAAELYWVELVAAAHLRDEREGRQGAAWRHLVELLGGPRAAWVAKNTKPSDWNVLAAAGSTQSLTDFLVAADPAFFTKLLALSLSAATRAALTKAIADHDGDAFSRLAEAEEWGERINTAVRTQVSGFPAHDLTKTDAWSRAPRTNVLPDRFVLLLYSTDTAEPRQIPGALVPDTVFLGPDPLDATGGFEKASADAPLAFGPTFDWMANFDKAVAQGLGFRVDLSEQEARDGFARVMVLGVRLSADASRSAIMLEELIANHQFSPKGFSLVPQGTPTNNTERDGTGYSDNDPFNDLAFFTDLDPPAFDPASTDPRRSQTDGRLLADALGISYSALQTVQHADQTDVLEATAMNTTLFPSTLGYWLRTWMSPVVTAETARQTRAFFTRLVTGRGPLPAVRVGNQPYGMLVTSDLSRWKYPPRERILTVVGAFGGAADFLERLHQLLLRLASSWNGLADGLPYVGRQGTDSSDVLMNILGLHPVSVEFYQRIGYSDEYLRNMDAFKDRGRYANELASLVRSMPATARLYLRDLGFEEDITTVGSMRSLHVLWQHYITQLDVPNLVENKPVSETQPLTVNYIDWLAKATDTAKIINQQFDGTPPSALLYLMLRNAILLQLHHGAYEWLVERSRFDEALERSLVTTTLPGVRETSPALSKIEVMTARVEVAEPSHPSPSTTIADWIWRGPDPTEIEAAFVKQQRAALGLLASASTARLERCFVEHLDCCHYRLDAWETGLFTERLHARRNWGSAERDMGIYLGAFGWVEHVAPSAKTFLTLDDLPASVRPDDGEALLEEDEVATATSSPAGSKQGGFMHAPSINHAAAGALLRNAYLSHATPEQADIFSINLSSERVRRAEFVLEGMRNGQPIEAMLGYQFERGLHDRTSESAARGDVPVLELNEFILPYRQAFPFQSREVVQVGTGAPSQTVPAYSVVNGLSLTTAVLSTANGYGLDAILPPADRPIATQGAAILAERDALVDTLDAVKDLLMAENAYQLVQGNFDRVAAVSLAQKDARIPPALDVIKTPRGSELTFTNRLTLHFDDLDETLHSSNPWPVVPMTPRASAEPGMNRWLGDVLGRHPEQVRCKVSRDNDLDVDSVTLADLGIQPIDFVSLVGIATDDTHGATELETRIACHYRRAHGVANDAVIQIDFDPAGNPGDTTFARLFPLARHLRALLAGARPLRAADFLPAAGGKATAIPIDKTNPDGYDAPELRNRVQRGIDALIALADALDGSAAPPVSLVLLHDVDDPTDDEAFAGSLRAAFTKLEEQQLTFADEKALTINFLTAHAESVHRTLQAVAGFGISDAFPPEGDLSTDAAKAALLARAHRVARRLRNADPKDGVLDRAVAAMAMATTDKPIDRQISSLLDAAKTLFSETVALMPSFTCTNEIDLATADAARGQLLAYALSHTPGVTQADVVDEWIQALARVRPQVYRWEIVRALVDGLNDIALELRPVQIPHRAKDSWLAVEFPTVDPFDPGKPFGISRDTLSIAAHGASAFQPHAQRGLLLDEWTEEIPSRSEVTGISFRFNQPNAAPPQTLLLAISPEETGSWNWDHLVGTLVDTLARAKRRAVEPAQLEKQGLVWNAFVPALVSEFSTISLADVSLDLMMMADYSPLHDFYAVRSTR
jgi:hypothetical protein